MCRRFATSSIFPERGSCNSPSTAIRQHHLPENYSTNTVVYTGTHDNATTREWFESCRSASGDIFWDYLRRPEGEIRDAAPELIRLAWSSPAALAITPLQDLLNLGGGPDERPGAARGNWRWRATRAHVEHSRVLSGCGIDESQIGAGVLAGHGTERMTTTPLVHNSAVPSPLLEAIMLGRGDLWVSPSVLFLNPRLLIPGLDENARSYPLGATLVAGGVNFCLFSRMRSEIELLFFDREDARALRA